MSTPELSVITVTHNRRELLTQKLHSLEQQTLKPELFELVLCVNGCSDGTREMLDNTQTSFNLKLLFFEDNEPIARARNVCVSKAQGNVLLMSDDDCILAPEALQAHLTRQERFANVAVIGALKLPGVLRHGRTREPFEQATHWGSRVLWINATGANTSFPAEAFRAVGGYDESFVNYGGEDPDLALRLKNQGMQFRFAPKALAYHAERQLADNYLKKAYAAGQAQWRVYQKFPSLEVGLLLGVHPWILALKRLLFNRALSRLFKQPRYQYEYAYLKGALNEKVSYRG